MEAAGGRDQEADSSSTEGPSCKNYQRQSAEAAPSWGVRPRLERHPRGAAEHGAAPTGTPGLLGPSLGGLLSRSAAPGANCKARAGPSGQGFAAGPAPGRRGAGADAQLLPRPQWRRSLGRWVPVVLANLAHGCARSHDNKRRRRGDAP